MRGVWALPCLLLVGCSGLFDRAVTSQTAADKLRADLGADVDFVASIKKDIYVKNAELEYVSYSGYSCGSDDDPTIKEARAGNRNWIAPSVLSKAAAQAKKDRISDLKARYEPVKLILQYGETLSSILESKDAFEKNAKKLNQLVDTYKGYATGPYALGLKAMKDLVNIGWSIGTIALQAELSRVALEADPVLRGAKDDIVKKGILKGLSEREVAALRAWDACALDRLYFLRAFNPKNPLFKKRELYDQQTAGEFRSSVLDFAAQYKTYLTEREAFVGRRGDYVASIDAIIDANHKIAHYDPSFGDILDLLIGIGGGVNDVREKYEQARADNVI